MQDQSVSLSMSNILLEQLDSIKTIARKTSKAKGLASDCHKDFVSYVILKFVENDYRRLQQFRHNCQWKTYLTKVIKRLWINFLEEQFGKWRSSQKATQLGTHAQELERLVYREGFSLREAIQILNQKHHTTGDSQDWESIYQQLPTRLPKRFIDLESANHVATSQNIEQELLNREEQRVTHLKLLHIKKFIASLNPEDQNLLWLRFEHCLTIPQISKRTGIKNRSLYFKLNNCIKHVRKKILQQPIIDF